MSDDTTCDGERDAIANRRCVLSAVGTVGAVAMAGCMGGNDGSSGSSGSGSGGSPTDGGGGDGSSSQSVFDSVGFEGSTMTVTLADASEVSQVNAIRDDEQVGGASVPTGASAVELGEVSETFRDVEVMFVAVDDAGERVAETTKTLSADATVTRVRSAATREGLEPTQETMEENDQKFMQAEVTVENTGSAPLFVPTRELLERELSYVFLTSGVPAVEDPADLDESRQEPVLKPVAPGETRELTAFSGLGPFNFWLKDKEEWPEAVRKMGDPDAFPEGYGDGDEVDVGVVVEDEAGEAIEATVPVTYSGGVHVVDSLSGRFAPARVDGEI